MQSVRVPHKIPVILNKQEVARLIACAGNLKHQTALALAYATGLRVNEVISLKVSDIDILQPLTLADAATLEIYATLLTVSLVG